MRKAGRLLLCASVLLSLLAGASFAGSYQGVCGIPFAGATDDRGIGVNKNPSSPYYGYFYGATSGSTAVRIWKPDAGGASASSYTNTGNKLGYTTNPTGALIMNAFAGSDDTVWVVDYGAKQICTGPAAGGPTGGNLTVQIPSAMLAAKPRSVFVTGALGADGTRVYVAEYESATVKNCEVFEYSTSTSSWSRIAQLGAVVPNPWFVVVDKDGNSYWGSNSASDPAVKKVDSTFNVVTTWAITRPAWLASWTVGGVAYVYDPADATYPEYLYVSAYNKTSILRFDMNGNYIDGCGNLGSGYPAGTWTYLAFSGPGGNSTVWLTADDAHNAYVMVNYPSAVQAYKVHLQMGPSAPTALAASNDVYGQIKLSWNAPAPSANDPTGYKIYRGASSGAETYYATTDSYTKWKDSAQGQTPGGPFYYYVRAVNGSGESLASNEVGPVSVASSTAPAPRSLGTAVSYSELNQADTVNNPSYDTDWNLVDIFLADRGVAYTKVWDAVATPPTDPTIEGDAIAGYKLLILASNRNMSSYEAQCIRDYVKYSQGVVLSSYNNSIANAGGVRQSDFLLSDVYRANAGTLGSGGSPWVASSAYKFLRQFAPAAPEAATLFAGLTGASGEWDGAQQYSYSTYLVKAFTDGTASEVGKWYDISGAQSIADPDDVGLIVGYTDSSKTTVQSVYTGTYWWAQARGSLSAIKFVENLLAFLGVSFTPSTQTGSVAVAKTRSDNVGVVLSEKVVTAQMTQNVLEPGPMTGRSDYVFYIQDPANPSGIKVMAPEGTTVSVGDVVELAGTIITDRVVTSPAGVTPVTYGYFERAIDAMEMKIASGTPLKPLYVGNKAAGGGTQGSQIGVTGGVGLNNVGLYVTVTGKVTQAQWFDAVGNNYFLIDDGGGYKILTEPVSGIKIIGQAPAEAIVGSTVRLTGAIGAEYVTDGVTSQVIPVIRMDSAAVAVVVPH